MNARREKLISALRHIARVLEAKPLVPTPYFGTLIQRVDDADQMLTVARAYGGFWEKSTDNDSFRLRQELSEDIAILAYTSRENVCTRVVVGTKVIPAETLPAREETVIPERVEEVVEWHCPESLNELVKDKQALNA